MLESVTVADNTLSKNVCHDKNMIMRVGSAMKSGILTAILLFTILYVIMSPKIHTLHIKCTDQQKLIQYHSSPLLYVA